MICVCVLIGYWGVLMRLGTIWWNKDDYSHGFFVPAVTAVYFWLRRESILESFGKPQSMAVVVAGIALLVLAMVTRAVGILGRALPVEAVSLIPLLGGIVLILYGKANFFRLLPGILFLILMFPIPGGVIGPLRGELQSIATKVSVFSLQTMGVPALARGNVIALPDAEVGVAEACSGLRMLISFTALVVGFTMFIQRTKTEKTILLVSIIPIAIIVNAWRVVMVSLATQYAPDWADAVHDAAGLGMMLLALAILGALLKFLDILFIDPDSQLVPSLQRTVTG